MEAQKLKKKKYAISKGKLKKTIKNVICRSDPAFWPVVTEAEEIVLRSLLEELQVQIQKYKKPHWNDVKLVPKNERPQAPLIQKVEGLIFGMSTCCKSLNCSAVLIDANVNPQAIVQPLIEACTSNNTPVLCLTDLKTLTFDYFGIRTSCLGIQKMYLQELSNKIHEIFNNYKIEKHVVTPPTSCTENEIVEANAKSQDVDIDLYCPYLYRTDRKSRAFVPAERQEAKVNSQFTGQQFIKLPQETKEVKDRKAFLRMMLKKVSNNPNRVKIKE